MCCHIDPSVLDHSRSAPSPAKALTHKQRQELAIQAIAGAVPISTLAEQSQSSRKFVYRQQTIALEAVANAFNPPPADDKVLFYLPVTKSWLFQFVIGLVLIGHCPLRGVIEICRDFFNYHISLGTIHNIIKRAVRRAHDEIFQHGRPVLVGVDSPRDGLETRLFGGGSGGTTSH